MKTKPVLIAVISFLAGGLLVGASAMAFNGDEPAPVSTSTTGKSMSHLVSGLQDKTGDEYDKLFLSSMLEHHEGAVEMAKLSAGKAKHSEVKQLSADIIAAQEKEITQMKQWQNDWGYTDMQSGGDMPMSHEKESGH